MAQRKFLSDLQRVKDGECCRLGDIFWRAKHGHDMPEHAQTLAAHVAAHLEEYSPMLTLASMLNELDLDSLETGEG